MQHLAPGCDRVHLHAITPTEMPDTWEETPATGQTQGKRWDNGTNLGFPSTYGINQPKQQKHYVGGASCGES